MQQQCMRAACVGSPPNRFSHHYGQQRHHHHHHQFISKNDVWYCSILCYTYFIVRFAIQIVYLLVVII